MHSTMTEQFPSSKRVRSEKEPDSTAQVGKMGGNVVNSDGEEEREIFKRRGEENLHVERREWPNEKKKEVHTRKHYYE